MPFAEPLPRARRGAGADICYCSQSSQSPVRGGGTGLFYR